MGDDNDIDVDIDIVDACMDEIGADETDEIDEAAEAGEGSIGEEDLFIIIGRFVVVAVMSICGGDGEDRDDI